VHNGSLHLGTQRRKISNEGPRRSPKSDSMRNHPRRYRRAWFIVTLSIGLGAGVSCRSDRKSDPFLERHSQELVDLTVPIDSSSIARSSVQRTAWAEKASWEFDTKMSRTEYTDWVNGKLEDRFRVASSTESQLSFSRNLDNDTETITVHLAPSGDQLHVRVEAGISPD
jgi:hypothetical protein